MEKIVNKTKVEKTGGKKKVVKAKKLVVESSESSESSVEVKLAPSTDKKTKSKVKKTQVVETSDSSEVKLAPSTEKKTKAKKTEVSETSEVKLAPSTEKKTKAKKSKDVSAVETTTDVVEESTVNKKTKKTKTKKVKDPNAPKKELNPIMKEMNRFRNEVIGPVVGSKAPKLTIPPFKKAMADAREQMKLGEKDKNTVDSVLKAIELFGLDNSKYL
jgi:hypothetical protein